MISLILLCLSIVCYSISQLQQHGKLKWMQYKGPFSFFGERSDMRKYKGYQSDWRYEKFPTEKNWYYKLIGQNYKERWPTSTWLTVAFTDGYHLMQFFFFLFISLSSGMALGLNWWLIAVVWLLVHLVHFGVYRLLQK